MGQAQQLYGLTLNSSTGSASSIFAGRYSTINRINRVLNGVELVSNETNQDEINQIKAQLLALRALCHFDVYQYFTEDYQDPNALSAIIVDYVPEISEQPQRNTVQEVLDFIKSDLDEAASLIDEAQNDTFYIDGNTIKAIKTRVALFEGDYDTAENLADELVSAYPLAGPQEYINVFQDNSFAEVIFSLARGQGESQVAGLFYFNNVSLGGNPYLEMSNGLYNELDPNDVRFSVLVHPESVFVGTDSEDNILLINKYPGSVEPLVNDIKLFRSSEMLLIRAEAEARDGRFDDAEQSIKTLLDARYGFSQPAPNFDNLDQALNSILRQRRIELAYEGHRYLDIKRIGLDLNQGINRNPTDCASFSAPCGLPRNDYRFTLPIPQAELNANPVITQNTGY